MVRFISTPKTWATIVTLDLAAAGHLFYIPISLQVCTIMTFSLQTSQTLRWISVQFSFLSIDGATYFNFVYNDFHALSKLKT